MSPLNTDVTPIL